MAYSHNTKSKFAPIYHNRKRLGHIRPHCYDLENLSLSKSSKQGSYWKFGYKKLRLKDLIVLFDLNAT